MVEGELIKIATGDDVERLEGSKVDKVLGKGLSTNDYSTLEKNKLLGIEAEANKYVHPSTHSASIIVETTAKNFVSNTEKANWDNKETTSGAQAKVNIHEAKKTNPHGVTKTQVGLSNVDNIKQASKTEYNSLNTRFGAHIENITTKEGQHGIRYWGGELQLKIDGVWTEFKSGIQFPVGNTKNMTVTGVADSAIEIKWGDPDDTIVIDKNGNDVVMAELSGTLLLAKKDSYPVNKDDGIMVVDSKVRDEFLQQPFIFNDANDGEEWFFMAFPYTKEGVITVDSHNRGSVIARDKKLRDAPNPPSISDLKFDRVTITGVVGTVVSIDGSTWYSSPHTFTGLSEETSYTAYAKYTETETHLESPASSGKGFTTPPDMPGPSDFVGGNMNAGYFGVVPASELFTGAEIASACGITQGTAQFGNEGWLKFAIDGKIIYKSKKTIRHSISWDHINSQGCVDGTKTVTKDGHTYKVRLMKGLHENNPTGHSGTSNHGSEWNRLMLPIHEKAPNSWAYPNNVSEAEKQITWGVNFSDADLHTHNSHGDGSYHWCQETSPTNASHRVIRGYSGVSYSFQGTSSNATAGRGWSPVLELIS